MFKLVLEKAEEPEMKLPISAGSLKKQESSRKTSISALLTMPKPLTVWITINCGKFWRRWEYQTICIYTPNQLLYIRGLAKGSPSQHICGDSVEGALSVQVGQVKSGGFPPWTLSSSYKQLDKLLATWMDPSPNCWIRMEGTHVCLWPIYTDERQKPSQYCKVIILQLK